MSSAKDKIFARMEELGIDPKRSLGQNFLINDEVIQKIVKTVERCKAEEVVEVGPGLGSLTDHLIELPSRLRLVELDRALAKYWENERGCEVTEDDALQLDWRKLGLRPQWVLVSNLPFQISSSLVIERSLEHLQCKAMVLMFQKEVAQRITAQPKTADYGLLSAAVQPFWLVEKVCDVSPQGFSPQPRVASRVLKFTAKESTIVDRHGYFKMIKQGFAFRRKFLLKSLRDWAKQKGVPEQDFAEWLLSAKIGEKARAEEVSVAQWVQLYNCWKQWESK